MLRRKRFTLPDRYINNGGILPPLRFPFLWYGLGVTALMLVALASLLPPPDLMLTTSDKFLHWVTYSVLAAGFSLLVRVRHSLLYVASGLILYGMLIEVLQGLTGYRFAEWGDVLANSVGVLCGLLVWLSPLPRLLRYCEAGFDKSN